MFTTGNYAGTPRLAAQLDIIDQAFEPQLELAGK
jgi:hypothetical protein